MYKLATIAAIMSALNSGAAVQPKLEIDLQPLPPVVLFSEEQHRCLADTMYWEGRNQDLEAMAAIGHVVMNRVKDPEFPNTACAVVHQGTGKIHECQFSYYCDGKSDEPDLDNDAELQAWDMANILAELILIGEHQDNTNGGTFYHATYVDPDWSEKFILVAAYGDHVFYVN
jgi:spore germination cell wall hydrolase CwlJ-like protein